MLTGHFPYLQEDGTSITFSRDKALAREDMEFASWEHPMVLRPWIWCVPQSWARRHRHYQAPYVAPRHHAARSASHRELRRAAVAAGGTLPAMVTLRLLVDARGKDLAQLLRPPA